MKQLRISQNQRFFVPEDSSPTPPPFFEKKPKLFQLGCSHRINLIYS